MEPGFVCVQATSLGLKGEDALVTDESFYEKMSAAMETVPMRTTDFMERCKEQGVKCPNGFSMLLYQAVEAYEIWNNCILTKEQIDIVRSKLENE